MLTREAAFVAFQLLLLIWNAPREKSVCHAFAACTFNKASIGVEVGNYTVTERDTNSNADTTSGRYHRVCLAFRVRRVG
jgi:hypothetical protein